jgi:hypothetical protein|tara:strand:- start:16 stop:582 length:567 start_codon:yes stop_codon:yes gene_type:complete
VEAPLKNIKDKMIKVPVTDEIEEYAKKITASKNFGVRAAGFNGNREKQTTGIMGELAVYKLLDKPFPDYEEFSFGDIDINGKQIDIKTRRSSNSYMRPGWPHNLVKHQLTHLVEVVLFLNYNAGQRTMEIDGWLTKEDIIKNLDLWSKAKGQSSVRDDGTRLKMLTNNIEVPTEAVNKLNSVEELQNI